MQVYQNNRKDLWTYVGGDGWLGATLWASAVAAMGSGGPGVDGDSPLRPTKGAPSDGSGAYAGWSFATAEGGDATTEDRAPASDTGTDDEDNGNESAGGAAEDALDKREDAGDTDDAALTPQDALPGPQSCRWQLASPSPPHGSHAVVALLVPQHEPFARSHQLLRHLK